MKRHTLVLAGAAAAMALAVSACASTASSNDGSTSPNGSSTVESTQHSDPASGASAAPVGNAIKIGFSQVTQQSPFYVELGNGAKDRAKATNNELIFVDANGDVTKQNNDIQDLITRGVNVLIINPVDPKGIAPSLKAAEAAGIKVVTVDRPVESGAAAFVGRDNVAMGKLVGEQAAKTLGSAGGKIIEIQGDAGGVVSHDRSQGFHEAVQSNPNIKIVVGPYADYIRSEAVTAMQDLLQANPDVKAVYAHNDDMAMGALQVLNEQSRTDVKVFGVDGLMEAVKAIADGNQFVATAFNDPITEGAKAVDTAIALAHGEQVPSYVDAGTGLIDKSNAQSLIGNTLFAVLPTNK